MLPCIVGKKRQHMEFRSFIMTALENFLRLTENHMKEGNLLGVFQLHPLLELLLRPSSSNIFR